MEALPLTSHSWRYAGILVLAGFLASPPAGADDSDLAPKLRYWVDLTGQADITEVAARGPEAFAPLPGAGVHLGFSDEDHWFRVELPEPPVGSTRTLSLSNPRLGLVTLYRPDGEGGFRANSAGVRAPFWERQVPSLAPAFLLEDVGTESGTVYLRVRNAGSLQFHLSISPQRAFQKRASLTLAFSICLGASLLIVALYNFFTFLHLRQPGYFWIALFLTVCTLRQMTGSGTANMLLWPDAPFWARNAMTLTGVFALLIGVGMSHALLQLHTFAPRWARFQWGIGIVSVLGGVLSTTGMSAALVLSIAGSVLLPVSVSLAAIASIRRGSRTAAWFLFSWGIVLAACLVNSMVIPGYAPANLFTLHILDVALLGAGLSWTFTLTSQIKTRQKEEKRVLESKVRERTSALEEALGAVRTLRGLVPICSCCKKIRNDDGFWEQVEIYLSEHTEADFSHGLCPECAESNYPAYFPRNANHGDDG